MSTDRRELLALQAQARLDGRTCDFKFDKDGWIDKIFYRDPKAHVRQHTHKGMWLSPITFAELERTKTPQYD